MKLGFAQCETILNTLPVGYYAGRRVDTTLDAKEPTSFYSPMEDKIVVSYPIIAKRMETLPETADVEEAVRSMLYHEVSHAILTDGEKLGYSDINNIFEDERIETVLKDFYMNTNFKQQLYDICGGTVPKARDKKSAFFNAVRFRCGTPNIVKRVAQMINDFATLSPASAWHDCGLMKMLLIVCMMKLAKSSVKILMLSRILRMVRAMRVSRIVPIK